ncbi:MAG: 3'-5' exonuclease, partial [bacterium]
EEERRLYYVGITRAKEYLYLTRADSRVYYGQRNYNLPSIFLREIPPSLIEEVSPDRFQWIEDVENSATSEESSRSSARVGVDPPPKTPALHRRARGHTGPRLEVGQLVRHPFLGDGQIARFEGNGPNRRVVLRFAEGTEQSLLERYADLTPLAQEE